MTLELPTDLEERLEAAARARGLDMQTYVRSVLEVAANADAGLALTWDKRLLRQTRGTRLEGTSSR
jgi:predicted DNA-binding protein